MDAGKSKLITDTPHIYAGELNVGYEKLQRHPQEEPHYETLQGENITPSHVLPVEDPYVPNLNQPPVHVPIAEEPNSKKKKRILICVFVALVIIIAISVVVGIAVTTDKEHPTPPSIVPTISPPQIVHYASWTTWESWSGCSTSCGNGTKSRSRTCKTPRDEAENVVMCKGESTHVQPCTRGMCPSCAYNCSDGGTMTGNCTLCSCSGNIVTLIVRTPDHVPIQGVDVRPENVEYMTLGTTVPDGTLLTNSICPSERLVFSKPGFADAFDSVGSNTSKNVTMHKLGKLYMLVEPKDRVRFVGEPVRFACGARGSPPPTSYEWFLNDELVDSTTVQVTSNTTYSEVVLQNLTLSHDGMIRCRANGFNSAIYSNTATLNVKTQADSFCDARPLQKVTQLPSDCAQNGSLTYDVGACAEEQCRKSVPNETDGQYCCGPTKSERRLLKCSDFSLDILVTLECGCRRSHFERVRFNSRNKNHLPGSRVKFVGSVLDRNTTRPVGLASVYFLGKNIANTSLSGRFEFLIPKDTSRLSVTVKDHIANAYFDRTKVIHVNQRFGTVYENILMTKKSSHRVIELSARSHNIPIFGNDIEMSIDQLDFYSDGVKFNGSVDVSMNYIDPSDPDVEQLVPGDMVFTNDEGEVEDLRSFGMWQMVFDDTNGNEIGVQGDVDIKVSGRHLGATDRTAVRLWSMDPDGGRWQFENELRPRATGTDANNMMSSFFYGNITLRGNLVYNFDSPSDNYCFVRIETYTDGTMSTISNWTSDRSYKARVVSAQSLRSDGSGLVITGAESYVAGTQIRTTRNCILTTCSDEAGSSEFSGFVYVNNADGPLSASDTLGGESTTRTFIHLDEQNRTIGTAVSPLTLDGPIYHANQTQCLKTQSQFCKNCLRNNYHRLTNPRCILCDVYSCRRSSSVAHAKCVSDIGNKATPHYRFYEKDNSHYYEFSFCKRYEDLCATSPIDYPLIWYPPILENTHKVRVWFIKIRTNTPVVFRAVSHKTKVHDGVANKIYGMRENITTDGFVCLEFKASGKYVDDVDDEGYPNKWGTDDTLVEIHAHNHRRCSLRSVTSDLRSKQVSSVTRNGIFAFKLEPDYLNAGDHIGLYKAEEDYDVQRDGNRRGPGKAREEALAACRCSTHEVKKCDKMITSGAAIYVNC